MPEEEKKKESPVSTEPMVDIDTSGPEVDVTLEETKDEAVVDTAPETKTQETVEEKKETEKKEDEKLEDYSKGVQARIAKLTRKINLIKSILSTTLNLQSLLNLKWMQFKNN
jgi:thymidylate synthase